VSYKNTTTWRSAFKAKTYFLKHLCLVVHFLLPVLPSDITTDVIGIWPVFWESFI